LVGGHLCGRIDVVFHKAPEARRIGMGDFPCVEPAHALALFLYADHDQLFVGVLSAAHALFLLAEDRLVHLRGTGYGVVARALHGLHHLSLEPPAGLLPQLELAGELGGGEPFFVGRQKVHDPEGLEEVELHLVEERARRGRLHVAAPRALPGVRRGSLAAVAVAAFGTFVAIAPFQPGQVRQAAVVVREFLHKVEKGHALESLLHVFDICFPEFTTFIVIG
tara:strand:- start:10516 stop:11181 length:666 start_codon:yes stop_codon:yes gene_type:complete